MIVQPTLTVTIDDVTYEVANMSEQVKQMLNYMDDWRQKEADAASELLMIRGAIRDVQNTLLATVKQEQDAATEAANATGEETVVDATVVNATGEETVVDATVVNDVVSQ